MFRGGMLAIAVVLAGVGARAAEPGGGPVELAPELCQSAIAAVERRSSLPPQLLRSIGLAESGRADPQTGRTISWPWTINVAGTGYFYPNRETAIAAVQRFQASGVQSIDVGCLQVNLMFHKTAFDSLEQAFNPQANVRYAASFLTALYRETGNWPMATAAYHSRTPELGYEYARRVMASWPLASRYGALPEPKGATAPVADLKIYTPEFAARLRQAAADRAALLSSMRGDRRRPTPGAVVEATIRRRS